MKISKLVNALLKIKEEHGDIECLLQELKPEIELNLKDRFGYGLSILIKN